MTFNYLHTWKEQHIVAINLGAMSLTMSLLSFVAVFNLISMKDSWWNINAWYGASVDALGITAGIVLCVLWGVCLVAGIGILSGGIDDLPETKLKLPWQKHYSKLLRFRIDTSDSSHDIYHITDSNNKPYKVTPRWLVDNKIDVRRFRESVISAVSENRIKVDDAKITLDTVHEILEEDCDCNDIRGIRDRTPVR